ncbi:M-phase phosphoprotein 8 [Aspergillus melleus]|uniref:M-phase phosphoprotein 8 n=1 Tax=Aspergillus melleus TaxID=138277 RepID=A0ACC3APC4_9EURO|nr:M-phase phosphoprotein 8 [Aspergillus melleus]
MVMRRTKFPDLPGSSPSDLPTIHSSKEDQRRARNRQAQRNHRKSVREKLQEYERLRGENQVGDKNPVDGSEQGSEHAVHPTSTLPTPPVNQEYNEPTTDLGSSVNLEPTIDLLEDEGPLLSVDDLDPLNWEWNYLSPDFQMPHKDANQYQNPPTHNIDSRALSEQSSEVPGRTLLHQAVLHDNVGMISALLEHGANVMAQDGDGFTPLHLAVFRGNEQSTSTLLGNGAAASVCVPSGAGLTPIHLAVQNGHVPLVQLLIKHGADVNARF